MAWNFTSETSTYELLRYIQFSMRIRSLMLLTEELNGSALLCRMILDGTSSISSLCSANVKVPSSSMDEFRAYGVGIGMDSFVCVQYHAADLLLKAPDQRDRQVSPELHGRNKRGHYTLKRTSTPRTFFTQKTGDSRIAIASRSDHAEILTPLKVAGARSADDQIPS